MLHHHEVTRVRDRHLWAALPWDDPTIGLLDPMQRTLVADYWNARAQAELNVGRAFSDLLAGIRATAGAPLVLDLLEVSIQNELDHADLCRRLASRYAGKEAPVPVMPASVAFPRLTSAPVELRPTLHAIGLCCINESIATIWLGRCLAYASAPLVRAATRIHVADEVSHARAGWAHLASLRISKIGKKQLAKWVLPLLRANLAQWLEAGLTLEVPAHGLPPQSVHRELVLSVVRDVVLPGFAHVGLDVPEAVAWARELPADFANPRAVTPR
jgi:hypothetical protein